MYICVYIYIETNVSDNRSTIVIRAFAKATL
jgi:hypothetical protein